MSNVRIIKTIDTMRAKNIPVEISVLCSNCNKEFKLIRKNRNWNRSSNTMNKVFRAIHDNTDVVMYCSKICSNITRDHSYMNDINKTFDIKCSDCEEFDICPFKNKNNGIQKSSISVKCYTKKNLEENGKITEWRNSEENKERWVKIGLESQKNLWKIYYSKDVNNKNWNKAKSFCEKQLKILAKNGKDLNFIKYKRDKFGNITHIRDISIDEYIKSIKKLPVNMVPEGFELISTFRSQNSNKRNLLLDEYLVKNNIKWFVYIKYDELGHPLVVGKSGSKLVNSRGCDVSFDKNPNGGPARQYLIKNNLDWNKTQVAIYKFENENGALNKEREIFNKMGLFLS